MGAKKVRSDGFRKVGDCLYRYESSGKYYAFIRHQGKLIKRSLETDDLAQAKRNLGQVRSEITRVNVKAGRMTLSALCDEYLKTLRYQASKTLKDKTAIAEKIKADWPGTAGAECQIRRIKTGDVRDWLASYSVGASYFNAHLWFVRGMFDHAIENRLLGENPATPIRARKRDRPIRRTPTMEQFRNLVRAIREEKLNRRREESADLIEFMGLAGVGNAEVGALTWGDIDFEADRITLFRKKTRMGYQIPIFPQLRPLLERRRERMKPKPADRVFTVKDAKKALNGACERLEYPHFDHRSLRRMFITNAIEKGVDIKVIADWQGHVDGGKLILDTYSHVRRPHHDRMAELLVDDSG